MQHLFTSAARSAGKYASLVALALAANTTTPDANAQALMYPTVETMEGVLTNRLVVGQSYNLLVIGDNRGQPNENTVGFEFSLKSNFPIQLANIPKLPYTNSLAARFFFKDYQLGQRSVRTNLTQIIIRGDANYHRKGPTNQVGVTAVFPFAPSTNELGEQIISLEKTIAYTQEPKDDGARYQPLIVENLTVGVVPEQQTTSHVIQNHNRDKHNIITLISVPNKKNTLEGTTNFLNWITHAKTSGAGETLTLTNSTPAAGYQFFRGVTFP